MKGKFLDYLLLTPTAKRYARLLRMGLRLTAKLLLELCLMLGICEVISPILFWLITTINFTIYLVIRCIFDAIHVSCGIRRKCTVFTGNLAFGGRGPELRRGLRRKGNNDNCLKAFATLFNATMGFPGEGWDRFSMATWNTRSLTFERFQFCRSLGYDVS